MQKNLRLKEKKKMKRNEAREKAAALVAKMTLKEKASQLRFDAPAIERLGIPAYNWWNEALHGVARSGVATSFPQAIGMAAMFSDELLGEVAEVISTEGRAKYNANVEHNDRDIYKGLTFWSPNINIFRDPRWGRGHETYGEDPYLTSRLGVQFVKGLQGNGKYLKAAACAKHFAVHSGPEAIRHSFNAEATPKDLWETYLPAFETLVKDADVEAVMGAYNRTNGEACCASKFLLEDILRGKWGFKGHVVSDCWALRDLFGGHHVCDTPAEAAALAISRGCDVNCGNTFQYIEDAVEQGLLTEEQITEACVRAYTTRFLLGIMGGGSEYDSIPFEKIECPEHLKVAEDASLRACVLLKNNGVLPINPEVTKTIGVIGPNANSRRALIGNYYGTSSRYITVLEGLQDALEGKANILYSTGCALKLDRVENLAQANDRLAEALTVAEHSDVVVLVLGLDESLEGEEPDEGNKDGSGDKKDLLLPEPQRKLMKEILKLGKKTVIVLSAGSSIDLEEGCDKADAVLLTWYPGARGGKAVAELLLGEVSPSGKLPVTFYKNSALDDMPEFTDYSMRDRTYKYYTGTPLYPFGFGLTYGKCSVTGLTCEGNTAKVTVVNEGTADTEDVIELYIKDEKSPDAPVNPILCGFKRVSLKAGETKSFELEIDKKARTVVNDAGERIPGSGVWTLYAGFSQPDARSAELGAGKCLSCSIGE